MSCPVVVAPLAAGGNGTACSEQLPCTAKTALSLIGNNSACGVKQPIVIQFRSGQYGFGVDIGSTIPGTGAAACVFVAFVGRFYV